MSETTHKTRSDTTKRTLLLISILGYCIFLVIMFTNVISGSDIEKVPLTNLAQPIHLTVLTIIWPIVGGFLAILVFPRLLVPLYLKLKNIAKKDYTNFLIEMDNPLSLKIVLKRAFMVFLLVMGLESVILPMVDITIFYMPTQLLEDGLVEGQLPYGPQAFIVTTGLLFPLAMMLWAVVWAIQDSGLMHYQLSADPTKYQEIEPVYFRIVGYVKGFAGITAFFFYLNAIYQISIEGFYMQNFLWILFVSVVVMVWSFPFIILYSYLNFKWITKNVKKLERLREEDLRKIP